MTARFVKGKIDETASELKQLGFENVVKGQALEITDKITKPTLYMGQVVKIMADCSTDLAVMAQICEIHGKVDGKDTSLAGKVMAKASHKKNKDKDNKKKNKKG